MLVRATAVTPEAATGQSRDFQFPILDVGKAETYLSRRRDHQSRALRIFAIALAIVDCNCSNLILGMPINKAQK